MWPKLDHISFNPKRCAASREGQYNSSNVNCSPFVSGSLFVLGGPQKAGPRRAVLR